MSTPTGFENPEEHLKRAIEYKINGEYDLAVEELQIVLAAVPEHPRAHLELGLVYGFTGLFDESIEELQKAVSLKPEDLDFRMKLGLTNTMLGMYDEAREQFNFVIGQEANSAEADEARKQLRFFDEFAS